VPDGSVSGSGDINLPTERINVLPGKDTGAPDVDPFTATPEELVNLEKEQSGEEIPPETPPEGEEIPPETTPPDLSEFEMDAESEKAYLADLGPDFAQYGSIREALLELKQGHDNLEPAYQRDHQVVERLDKLAKALGGSVDDVIGSLAELDPQKMAQYSPQYANLNQFVQTNVEAEHQPFYQQMTAAMLQDIVPAVQAQFSRMINSIASDITGLRTDMQIDKFIANPKNSEWVGREADIKHALDMNPKYKGERNAMDLATRFIKAGAEPAPVKRQVSEQVRKKMQDIQARKRAGHLEGPGRGAPAGKPETDIDKMSHDQVGALLDDAERRGARVG